MCGIAGVHIKDDKYFKLNEEQFLPFLEKFCNELALGIENRGRHATGFGAVSKNGKKINVDKGAEKASEFIKTRKPFAKDTRTVLIHTRFVTQGDASNNGNNHPVFNDGVWVTHNGTISNDLHIFQEEDLHRNHEVDSEAIAALIGKYGFGQLDVALPKLGGSFAFAAVDMSEPGKVILAKGPGYPLVVHENKQFVVWASTGEAIKRAWRAVLSTEGANAIELVNLDEGDVVRVDKGEVKLESKAFEARTYSTSNSYDHQAWGYGGCDEDDDAWWSFCGGDYDEPAWEKELATRGSRYTKDGSYTVLDLKRPVEAKRAAGNGIAKVYETASRIDKATKSWERCPHCTVMVYKQDIHGSAAWDRICDDCKWFAVNHRYLNTKAKINDSERDDLEGWADTDQEAVKYAIEQTSFETGLKPNAVFYLVFTASEKYLEKNKKIGALAAEIREKYNENLGVAFECIFDSTDNDKDEPKTKDEMVRHEFEGGTSIVHMDTEAARKACVDCTPKEVDEDEDQDGWSCGCGERHPIGVSHCPKLGPPSREQDDAPQALDLSDIEDESYDDALQADVDAITGERDAEDEALEHLVEIDLEKNDWRFAQCEWITCTKAGQVTHHNRRYCVEHLAIHAQREREEKAREIAATKERNKCGQGKCRRKAKNFVGDTGLRFCDAHWKKCSANRSKCEGKPVASLKTNYRLCHNHVRGMKGAIFDNDKVAVSRAEKRSNDYRRPLLTLH